MELFPHSSIGSVIPPHRKQYRRAALLLIIAGLAILFVTRTSPPVDDAMITFRYAENLASGKGFVYNPGERVQGTSTPLFTFLLAGGNLIGLSSLSTALIIGYLSFIVTAFLLYRMGEELHSPAAGLLSLLFLITNGTFMLWQHQGMETPLYCATIIAALYLGRSDHLWFAALPALVRLDGLMVGAALAGVHVLVTLMPGRHTLASRLSAFLHDSKLLRSMGGYLLIFLPWCMYALINFGSILPQSMVAKQFHEQAVPRFWMVYFLIKNPFTYLAFFSLLLRKGKSLRHTRMIVSFLVYLLVYVAAFSVVRLGEDYEWYLVPVVMVTIALSGPAAAHLLQRALAKLQISLRASTIAGSAALLLYLAVAGIIFRREYLGKREWAVNVEETRVRVAEYIRDQFPPTALVCAGAIGHVGYVTRMYMIDWLGLATPQVEGESIDEVIRSSKPDLVVGHDLRGRLFTRASFPSLAAYPFYKEFPLPGNTEWGVYRVYSRIRPGQ